MKNILKFLLIYALIIGVLFSFKYSSVSSSTEQLSTINSKLKGVDYLESLYHLSIAVLQYVHCSADCGDSKKLAIIKQEMMLSIEEVYRAQKHDSKFVNIEFNDNLERIRTSQMSEDDYYKFINDINHENFAIGEKSHILFEEDKEAYFLGSLITHYMPEFLISSLLSHNIIEEFSSKNGISNKKKNIFIEQTKLTYLSAEELGGIIKSLDKNEHANKLNEYIDEIEKELTFVTTIMPVVYRWENSKKEIEQYIKHTHKVLDLGYKLNDEHIRMIKIDLENKKSEVHNKIFQYKMMFLFTVLMITVLMYFYYRSYTSNIEKDIEIKKINETMDEYVVFSKTDADGVMTYASRALEKLTGYTQDELIGATPRLFRHEDNDPTVYTKLWETISAKKIYSGTLLNKTKEGRSYWIKVLIIPDLNKADKILGFSAYVVDITDQKALEAEKIKTQDKAAELLIANKKLERLSVIDTLTQVYNRLKLDVVMQRYYESYQRYKKVFSIIIIDIDNFKDVNDTYGHLIGDETLKDVVNIIQENIRKADVLGRWGGEEFMIICEETDADGAYRVAEKIRKAVESHVFEVVGKNTVSLGVAQMELSISLNEFIKRADDALYVAKESGRNKSAQHRG